MVTGTVKLQYESNTYLIRYFESETVSDIMQVLSLKYHFINDQSLAILQNSEKLAQNQKINDLKSKKKLFITGKIMSESSCSKEEEIKSLNQTDNILKFREMGFKEPSEIITQLLNENDNKFEVVIAYLLKMKQKKKL